MWSCKFWTNYIFNFSQKSQLYIPNVLMGVELDHSGKVKKEKFRLFYLTWTGGGLHKSNARKMYGIVLKRPAVIV